jgi:hypothetical protein
MRIDITYCQESPQRVMVGAASPRKALREEILRVTSLARKIEV